MRKTDTLKHVSPASRAHLGIFILVFAAIGGVVIWRSLAAPNPNLPGDLNNDNTVNVTDMSILLSNYGTSNTTADINSDGTVNILDMSILLSNYGKSVTTSMDCVTSNTSWQSAGFTAQAGSFSASFYATPSGAGNDNVSGFSSSAATEYTSLAVAVRFNATNTIDARNGGAYSAINSVSYTPGKSYLFEFAVDLTSHTYTVYVTPGGGSRTQIANNYDFRTEQAAVSSLSAFNIISANGTQNVCNPVVNGNPVTFSSQSGGGGGGSTRIYTADFSTGDFSQVDSLQESSAGRITLVSPGIAGNRYAAKIIAGPQDQGVAGASGIRTELSVQSFSSRLGGGSLQGKDVWAAWVFKLGTGFLAPAQSYEIIGQFHAGVGSPSFAIDMQTNGQIIVEQRGGAYTDNGGNSGNYKSALLMSSPSRDVEYNVTVFRHWSTGSDGVTKVWINKSVTNTPEVSMTGPTLEIGYESAPYMKIGMYGGSWPSDNTVYVSNIRWATTAAGL